MKGLKTRTRRIWLTLEAEEIIELKQLMMDRDVEGARAFFHRVVVPRVRQASERLGMSLEGALEQLEEDARSG